MNHPLNNPHPRGPVLAVCGLSGAGKTTLIEKAIPRLNGQGLAVAVVKHHAHHLAVDIAGKDSDRLFQAGADVVLRGEGSSFARRQGKSPGLDDLLFRLLSDHDVVLLEGHKTTPLPKVWLLSPGETAPPEGIREVLRVFPRDEGRVTAFFHFLEDWLPSAWNRVPLVAGLLVGGASRRMGQPKQLLQFRGLTLAETVTRSLDAAGLPVAVLGTGPLPASLTALPQIADPPGLVGPMAGIMAALRWWPGAGVLAAACDHPLMNETAVRWLIEQRRPGIWAIFPRNADGGLTPTFAIYEPQILPLLEEIARLPHPTPAKLFDHPRVLTPAPPPAILRALIDVDIPSDLDHL